MLVPEGKMIETMETEELEVMNRNLKKLLLTESRYAKTYRELEELYCRVHNELTRRRERIVHLTAHPAPERYKFEKRVDRLVEGTIRQLRESGMEHKVQEFIDEVSKIHSYPECVLAISYWVVPGKAKEETCHA